MIIYCTNASIAEAAKGTDEDTPLSRISQLSIDAMCLGQVRYLKSPLYAIWALFSVMCNIRRHVNKSEQ